MAVYPNREEVGELYVVDVAKVVEFLEVVCDQVWWSGTWRVDKVDGVESGDLRSSGSTLALKSGDLVLTRLCKAGIGRAVTSSLDVAVCFCFASVSL